MRILKSGGKLHWIKNLYLKLRYGGGCCDIFSLDYYLAKKIVKPLKRFRDVGIDSYPVHMTAKEWETVLDKMIWSFEFFLKDDIDNETIKNCEKQQEGFELFGKHFNSLWK